MESCAKKVKRPFCLHEITCTPRTEPNLYTFKRTKENRGIIEWSKQYVTKHFLIRNATRGTLQMALCNCSHFGIYSTDAFCVLPENDTVKSLYLALNFLCRLSLSYLDIRNFNCPSLFLLLLAAPPTLVVPHPQLPIPSPHSSHYILGELLST